jgi:hypothetical protein
MDGVRLSHGAAAVRPHAFVDGSHVGPSRSAPPDAAALQLSLPTSTKNWRLRSDVPTVVAGAADSAHGSDLKRLSRRRARGREPTVEAMDPDADAAGLMHESLYARLEEAYRRPSLATLMSDFKAKLGDSQGTDAEINSFFGLDSSDAAVESQAPVVDDASLLSNAEKPVSGNGSKPISVVKKRGSGRRANVEGNRILKITKNPSTRRPRKLPVTLTEPKEVAAATLPERGGKRRLSLRSRIAMKQNHTSAVAHPETLSPEDQHLWSPESEELINTYSTSLDLTAPLWDHLDHGLLSAAEENRLAMHMKPTKVRFFLSLLLGFSFSNNHLSILLGFRFPQTLTNFSLIPETSEAAQARDEAAGERPNRRRVGFRCRSRALNPASQTRIGPRRSNQTHSGIILQCNFF